MKHLKHKESIGIHGHAKFTLRDVITGKVRIFEYDNVVCTVGKAMLANNLSISAATDDPFLNYVAVGTNAAAPVAANTQLGTENTRVLTASGTNASNVAYVTGFFGQTQAVATLREAGIFSNGTASANSGVLFSHVAINITKSNTETLTLDWTVTIT
jgi:hypothetical protein